MTSVCMEEKGIADLQVIRAPSFLMKFNVYLLHILNGMILAIVHNNSWRCLVPFIQRAENVLQV